MGTGHVPVATGTTGTTGSTVPERTGTAATIARWAAVAARISLGWVFLWAFLDTLFGLGHETASKDAWINGGSPTTGFLKFAAAGPFKGMYNAIAGDAWANWLFMAGLAGVGVALVLGVTMRIAAGAGVLMLLLMRLVGAAAHRAALQPPAMTTAPVTTPGGTRAPSGYHLGSDGG